MLFEADGLEGLVERTDSVCGPREIAVWIEGVLEGAQLYVPVVPVSDVYQGNKVAIPGTDDERHRLATGRNDLRAPCHQLGVRTFLSVTGDPLVNDHLEAVIAGRVPGSRMLGGL